MARNAKDLTIDAEGRDRGKVFRITEMPASQAERWAMRALNAMARNNTDFDPELMQLGMAAIAAIGVRGLMLLPWSDLEPLMDEMLGCVQVVPSASNPAIVRPLLEEDVQEVATRILLRSEVLSIHLGFSIAAELSNWGAAAKKAKATSKSTSTSPKRSARSSRRG